MIENVNINDKIISKRAHVNKLLELRYSGGKIRLVLCNIHLCSQFNFKEKGI